MPRSVLYVFLASWMLLCLFTLSVWAAPPPDLTQDPGGFLNALYDAIKTKNLRVVVACGIVALVFVTRRWGSRWVPWFKTGRGGAVLVISVGVLGGVVTALGSSSPLGFQMLIDGAVMGFTAAGGWTVIKHLLGNENGR